MARKKVERYAIYKDFRLYVLTEDDDCYEVYASKPMPDWLLNMLEIVGKNEYVGKIPKNDETLKHFAYEEP